MKRGDTSLVPWPFCGREKGIACACAEYPRKPGGITYRSILLRVIFVLQYVYIISSAGVKKSLMVCFVERIT